MSKLDVHQKHLIFKQILFKCNEILQKHFIQTTNFCLTFTINIVAFDAITHYVKNS